MAQTKSRKQPVDNAAAARQAAANGTRAAGLAMAGAAKRAKVPLLIGGAATAGFAGSLAAIKTRRHRRQPSFDLDAFAAAAKRVSTVTGQVADIAGAMQRGQSSS